jgi:putative FmdB family regulatory protein
MPTYDYKCENCGHTFETFQSIKADPLTKCPSCGEEKLKRLIGAGAGLIFKGSGFYLTDYKNTGSSSKSDSSPVKEKSSSTNTKTSDTASGSKSPATPAKKDS